MYTYISHNTYMKYMYSKLHISLVYVLMTLCIYVSVLSALTSNIRGSLCVTSQIQHRHCPSQGFLGLPALTRPLAPFCCHINRLSTYSLCFFHCEWESLILLILFLLIAEQCPIMSVSNLFNWCVQYGVFLNSV